MFSNDEISTFYLFYKYLFQEYHLELPQGNFLGLKEYFYQEQDYSCKIARAQGLFDKKNSQDEILAFQLMNHQNQDQ
jgi:hypothetical protein